MENNKKLSWNDEIDVVDEKIDYMNSLIQEDGYDNFFHSYLIWLQENLKDILLPIDYPSDRLIYAGAWNKDFVDVFVDSVRHTELVAFDIFEYYKNNYTKIIDMREIDDRHEYNYSCGVFYNGLGSWIHNRGSKLAGYEYAKRNLLKGGLYIDNRFFFESNIDFDDHDKYFTKELFVTPKVVIYGKR